MNKFRIRDDDQAENGEHIDEFDETTVIEEEGELEEILSKFYSGKEKVEHLGDLQFYYWDGLNQLPTGTDNLIAIECQLEYIDEEDWSKRVPNILVVGVSTGNFHYIIPRENLASFIKLHSECIYVFHGCAKQFLAIAAYLEDVDEEVASSWWELGNQSQIRDTQILDSLLRYIFIFVS